MPKDEVGYDSYWRLWRCTRICPTKRAENDKRTALIQAAGYEFTPRPSADFITKYSQRVEKQLLCYHKCTDAELTKFIAACGIKLPKQIKTSNMRKTMINRLETADLNPEFKKFMDLPVELRCVVYGMYMEEFPEYLHMPIQPPITRVDRAIRTEALPLFYQTCSFEIRLWRHSPLSMRRLHVDRESYLFLSTMASVNLARLRSIRFAIRAKRLFFGRHFNCDVSFREVKPGFKVNVEDVTQAHAGPWKLDVPRIERAVDQVLGLVVQREGAMKPSLEDFWKLRRALEESSSTR